MSQVLATHRARWHYDLALAGWCQLIVSLSFLFPFKDKLTVVMNSTNANFIKI